ncbi:M23 family metallopeptidase [Polymorphobacter fuscus]|uniref:Peptidoglycan DD-metalloendopeptidase family protein n=1 Tax=Sandarakinorhabdus fusca TaxID=1439888 RepID=A0A7C9GNF8_9SPHN|nr:M23 family metallopeptidase [Polymorphobacter fuscus]KAB7647492.1 M23 family metallopeptidase [Polymorphobacter fuscus]MQT16752.1 peptidoglycan DD-metalloendopeptidase family protein [Polymorphobacter fuscus]NJC09260.1 murein DD-endopeptidase MepM/ murein hydrolase activator NlpD [Polymorphobacter fuscus]
MFQPEYQPSIAAALPAPGRVGSRDDRQWRHRFTPLRNAAGIDLAVDLGDNIGSRGWWIGLGLCGSLCAMALVLAARVPTLLGDVPTEATPAQREAMAPAAIAPLARGAATGITTVPNRRLVEPLADVPERPRLELSASIGRRDSFEATLRRAGVGKDDIAAVSQLLRPVTNPATLPRGTDIDLVLGRRETRSVPRPLESMAFRAAFDMRVAITRANGTLALRRIPIAVDSTPLRVQGQVGNGLKRALSGAGVPAAAVADAIRALGYAVDFQHGVGKRDRFDIIVAQDKAETGEVRFGNLLYAALRRDGKAPIALARFDPGAGSKAGEFFRSTGESAKKGLMRTPVDGARLTSGFGMRFHPLLAFSRMHQGVDFGAPSGSPIMAAASGTVAFAAPHGGHGNYVRLRHNADLTTGYAHMSRFAVKPGQRVTQGQVIGYVGSTGISTGPHLHYEVWLRGKPVSPMQLKFIGGTQLAGADLQRFRAQLARLESLAAVGNRQPTPAKRG